MGSRSFSRRGATRTAPRRETKRQLPSLDPRAALKQVPLTAWLCGLVALLSAASWSIVSPPFQGPDEQDHVTYVKLLTESRLPSSTAEEPPREIVLAYQGLDSNEITENPGARAIGSVKQQRQLEESLAKHAPTNTAGGAGNAGSEPPLYYALEMVPYTLAAGGSLLDRIALMRLLSALMGGISAVFVFLFLSEALPSTPWAWRVGGLGVALMPLLGFISGVVNPDAMLVMVSSGLFYLLARGFHRGLTRSLAVAIGGLTAIGFLTKLNFIGLAPGVLLGLLLLALRARSVYGRKAYAHLAVGTSLAFSPVLLYAFINWLSQRPALGGFSSDVSVTATHSFFAEASYIWQFYLPRLPGMTHYFAGLLTPVQIWFRGFIGKYGWLETTFPNWVYDVALIPAGLIFALCLRELTRCRGELRRRLGELIVYATLAAGLMILVGANSYLLYPSEFGQYAEPRYMLPLVALGGLVLALAARGAGRRWGPATGALIVMLILALDIFSQTLVIARYYGPL